MKNKKTLKIWIVAGVILLLALAGLIIFLLGDKISEDNKNYCTEDSRNYDFCAEFYEPVCGYPLQKTYSNSCFACLDMGIEFYINGECE